MSNLKKYLLSTLITILSIFLMLLLTTTFYYFNIISPTTYNILKIIFLLLVLFINCFLLGRKALKKGYLEGIKLSLPLLFIFLVVSFLTNSFTPKIFIYYLIILLTSSFGSMIGISTKKEL